MSDTSWASLDLLEPDGDWAIYYCLIYSFNKSTSIFFLPFNHFLQCIWSIECKIRCAEQCKVSRLSRALTSLLCLTSDDVTEGALCRLRLRPDSYLVLGERLKTG